MGATERIPEGNVGHQMLRRMGWEGTGLGSSHQGIQEPVRGGDVRDKGDKYKVCVDRWTQACSHSVYVPADCAGRVMGLVVAVEAPTNHTLGSPCVHLRNLHDNPPQSCF